MSSQVGFDPRAAAIESIGAEPALPEQALLFSSLANIFGQSQTNPQFPVWTPELVQDRRRPVRPFTPESAVRASVLITLVGEAVPSVVLTQRTQRLSDHAGQVSFPGGRAEPSDASEAITALREAQEEIGLDPDLVSVWGWLPDYLTATGYRVAPVIGWVPRPNPFVIDPSEVAELFHVPLTYLMNPAHHQVRIVQAHESPTGERIRFYAMPYVSPEHDGREFFIWGATAAMLRNLYHFLSAGCQQQRDRG